MEMNVGSMLKVATVIFALSVMAVASTGPDEAQAFFYVDRIEEGIAVLLTEEGLDLRIPVQLTGLSVYEGEIIVLSFAADPVSSEARKTIQRSLIEGILKNPD